MNQLIEDTFGAFNLPSSFMGLTSPLQGMAWPSISISEADKAHVVRAEVPGMDPKDVELAINEDMLILRGEKRRDSEGAKAHVSAHFYGRFERRMALPGDVDREGISAGFDKGVLTITLPKRAEAAASSKRIPSGEGAGQGQSQATIQGAKASSSAPREAAKDA
jgi:HSP20 family protein